MHRITERCLVSVTLWPVSVQGNLAPGQIIRGIQGFNKMTPPGRPDVLIVGRGGGSADDLMAFNQETVVRAAFDSDIPLISAVGHESDTTLIDYVSDKRAPTPTAAAEMAVPVKSDMQERINNRMTKLNKELKVFVDSSRAKVKGAQLKKPETRAMRSDIANMHMGLKHKVSATLSFKREKINKLKQGITPSLVTAKLEKQSRTLDNLSQRLANGYDK